MVTKSRHCAGSLAESVGELTGVTGPGFAQAKTERPQEMSTTSNLFIEGQAYALGMALSRGTDETITIPEAINSLRIVMLYKHNAQCKKVLK